MRTPKILTVASLTLALTSTLVGCASEAADAPSGMKVEKACMKTACAAKTERAGEACSRCTSACFDAMDYYDCDPSRACAASCSDRGTTCSESERTTCIEQGFTVESGEQSSPEIEAACGRFFDHLDACSQTLDGVDRSACVTWAKVERPETAKMYDCVIAEGCSGDPSACALAPTTLGAEVCDALGATCGEEQCTPETREALDGIGAFLRDDVTAAARSCAGQPSCSDAHACIEAWLRAIGH